MSSQYSWGVGTRSRTLAMLQISTISNLLSEPFRCTAFKQRRRYGAEPANPSLSFDVTRMIFFFLPLFFHWHVPSPGSARPDAAEVQAGLEVKLQTVPQVSGKDNNLANLCSESKQALAGQKKHFE